ncbi:MAG: NAD(P)/FAD-dependent oxidoreductase [Acidimicrobiales bacterium]
MHCDLVVIGGGPAGAAAAIRAARAGLSVVVCEKGPFGRDKVCGDGLTPRAVAALDELGIDLSPAHRIDGLRMIAGRRTRELPWPAHGRYGAHGAVWPRRRFDAVLIEAAMQAGADVRFSTEALPVLDGDRCIGIDAGGERITAPLTILATGAPGAAARVLGAEKVPDETFGLAIRSYAETPRHGERLIEACLGMKDADGTPIPGYGWMFPCGDGTVNIGVGALSTMKGFKSINLNRLMDIYAGIVRHTWDIGPLQVKPRAWRLPMSVQRRHGPGWVAVGDAAGLVNPMNGEGIDYGLESGMLAADRLIADPASAPDTYDRLVGERFDSFLRTGRRFSFVIGHPWLLSAGLRVAIGTQTAANLTLAVMGNLVDADTPGAAGRVLRLADRTLAVADPVLRRTRAAA